jgi:hypothetical protein
MVIVAGKQFDEIVIPSDAKFNEGQYFRGGRYIDADKVVIRGRLFDKNSEFAWTDPDWLSAVDDLRQGYIPKLAQGKIDEETVAEETGIEQYYRFKSDGYRITEDGEVDIFPKDQPLGRIPLYETDYRGGERRFVHEDQLNVIRPLGVNRREIYRRHEVRVRGHQRRER